MFLPAIVYDPEFEVGTSNLERYCGNMAGRNVSVLILYDNDSKILLQHRTKDAPTFPDIGRSLVVASRKANRPNKL